MRVPRTILASTIGALVAGAVLLLAVGTAPAGNRSPTVTLDSFPGPTEINYGENVGYTAKLVNSQSSNFTHLIYHHRVPTTLIGGVATPATLIYSSCEPGRTTWPTLAAGDIYACPELSQLGSGQTAAVLLVWGAPGKPVQGDNVTCGGATDCSLTSSAYWTMKEGTGNPGSSGPDTFPGPNDPPLTATTALLGAAPDLTKARGYVLNACSGSSSLETSVVTPVGPSNKLFTKVCAPTVPGPGINNGLTPGLIIQINETPGPITEDANICIPAPGDQAQQCSNQNYTPWTFSPRATFDFTIDNTTLPKNETIDKVFHRTSASGPFVDVTADCKITLDKKAKTTNVSCQAAQNGDWRYG
jgi:hypothetical protein